jgi:hypothetical protein
LAAQAGERVEIGAEDPHGEIGRCAAEPFVDARCQAFEQPASAAADIEQPADARGQRFEQRGLRLAGIKMLHADRELAAKHYPMSDEWVKNTASVTRSNASRDFRTARL